jgi:hypothetical protein
VLRTMIRFVLDRLPYVGALREELRHAGAFSAGHFHSPVPARDEIIARLQSLANEHDGLPGICLNREKQFELLQELQTFYCDLPFPEQPTTECRYHFGQSVFSYADAIFLYSFLRYSQPKRIIEVGSGFSSAIMLDTVDRVFARQPEITLIDPIELFSALQDGDLLFIDSSHVLKCGSDLQFLMFDVLPRLRVGVVVHFHDVFDSFEYPRDWLLKGWYWNEDYVLRAFLSYNTAWEVYLFGNYVVKEFGEWFAEHMPLCLKNPGGSLYIRRIPQPQSPRTERRTLARRAANQ